MEPKNSTIDMKIDQLPGGGACDNCKNHFAELFALTLSSGDNSRTFSLCGTCAREAIQSAKKKNAEIRSGSQGGTPASDSGASASASGETGTSTVPEKAYSGPAPAPIKQTPPAEAHEYTRRTVNSVSESNSLPVQNSGNSGGAYPASIPPVSTPPVSTPPVSTPPVSTPPVSVAPTYVAPQANPIPPYMDGPACADHPCLPAVTQCAKCGKYICEDCADSYTVIDGEYEGKSLCYSCCEQIVSENVTALKHQKAKIIAAMSITGVGMLIGILTGIAIGVDSENVIIGILCTVLFGSLFGSLWNWIKSSVLGWWGLGSGRRTFAAFVGSVLGAGIVAPVYNTRKMIEYIRYLKDTSGFLESDSRCLVTMKEYMDFTTALCTYGRANLPQLMVEGGPLYGNEYARTYISEGEEAADKMVRDSTNAISENRKRIDDFKV